MVNSIRYILISLFFATSLYGAKNLVGSIEGEAKVDNGRLNYNLPLSIPKGKNSLTPILSISYTQGSKDGVVGLGFNLSGLESISRCGESEKIDGYNGGIYYDEKANYCLNGTRLVKTQEGYLRAFNKTDIKVEFSGSIDNPESFRVYYPNGLIKKFGENNSKELNSAKKTINWKISSITDRLSNKIIYKYSKQGNSLYISSIKYNPYTINFLYTDRVDSLVTYSNGIKKKHEKLLESIKIKKGNKLFSSYKLEYDSGEFFSRLAKVSWCDKVNKCLKPVKFTYKTNDIFDDEVKDIAKDFTVTYKEEIDESGFEDKKRQSFNLWQLQNQKKSKQYYEETINGDLEAGLSKDEKKIVDAENILNYFYADMNRDGLADVCYYEKDEGIKCSLNNGNDSFSPGDLWTNKTESVLENNDTIDQAIISTLMPLDLNNDSKIDYCMATLDGIYCGINNGSGFSSNKYWSKNASIEDAFRFIDINQDKKIDLCKFTKSGLSCALNSGGRFGKFKIIDKSSGQLDMYKEVSKASYSYKNKIPQPQLLDINGDGFSDICGFKVKNNAFYCKLGTGYDNENKKPLFGKWKKWGSGFPLKTKKDGFKKIKDVVVKENSNYTESDYQAPTRDRDYYIKIFKGKTVAGVANKGEADYLMFDIDGDDKLDICSYNESDDYFYCKLNSNEKSISEDKDSELIKRFNRTFRFVDINNDNLTDICYRDNSKFVCRLNNGNSFNKPTTVLKLDKETWPYYNRKLEKNNISTFNFKNKNKIYHLKYITDYDLRWVINNQEGSISFEDINRDGLLDFRVIIAEDVYVAYNYNGTRFSKLEKIANIVPDVDVITKRKKVYANWLKKLFGLSTTIETNFVNSTYGPVKLAPDLDGKSNTELCYRSIDGLSCIRIETEPLALLDTITNSLGKSTKIEYGNIISDNLKDETSIDYKNAHYTNNFVVKSIIGDDGIGGTSK